jgi:hypothetical protein
MNCCADGFANFAHSSASAPTSMIALAMDGGAPLFGLHVSSQRKSPSLVHHCDLQQRYPLRLPAACSAWPCCELRHVDLRLGLDLRDEDVNLRLHLGLLSRKLHVHRGFLAV